MEMQHRQQLNLEQKLSQSPQMIQAMQVLQLNLPELLDFLTAEIEENPFLDSESPLEQTEKTPTDSDNRDDSDLSEYDTNTNLLESAPNRSIKDKYSENDYDLLQNVEAPDRPTNESLLSELRARDLPTSTVKCAEHILQSLNERGFLEDTIESFSETIAMRAEEVQRTLEIIREISHPALGALNLQECFLLQLDALGAEDTVTRRIIKNHFESLLANRIPQIAKAEEVSLDEVKESIKSLALFDLRPWPAEQATKSGIIVPDIKIEFEDQDSEPVISLISNYFPDIRLSEHAHKALANAKKNERLHAYLLKKIQKARFLIDAIQQRQQTILSISKVLARRQRSYLKMGKEYLNPLIMQEVADEIGIHISTVSRAIRGKYATTPQGIIALKSLFSGGQETTRGKKRTKASIQHRIEVIIEAEDKAHPLSDEEIARILKERDGTSVARRTVTKYRKQLQIPTSSIRKNYN